MGKESVIFVGTRHHIPPSATHTDQMNSTLFQWLLTTQDKLLIKVILRGMVVITKRPTKVTISVLFQTAYRNRSMTGVSPLKTII